MTQPNAHSTAALENPAHYRSWIGRTIDGRYRIDEVLGEGGMGAVFLAEHLKLRKKVAFKVIIPELAGSAPLASRFTREATASARLDHPNVASAIDYGSLPEGGAYLVMQYVRGESLRSVLDREGKLGWVRACEIGAQIADALHAAHRAGIIHRDLKPDNVMLEEVSGGAQLVKVLDFGVAHVVEQAGPGRLRGTQLTRAGSVIGTPGYMAPEQALGETIDVRTDLYALGLLLLEMTTGNALYGGMELTAIVTRQLTKNAPRLRELTDEPVSEELDLLLARMLARDLCERPDSAASVRDSLRGLLLGPGMGGLVTNPSLRDVSASELARVIAARRDSTPLGVPEAPGHPAGARQPAPIGPLPAVAGTMRKMRAVLAQLARNSRELVQRGLELLSVSGISPRRAALGCTTALACALMSGLAVWALTAVGSNEGSVMLATTKLERERPSPAARPSVTPLLTSDTPASLSHLETRLIESTNARDREAAAELILAHSPGEEVPSIVRALAELETARGCHEKRSIVVQLGATGDIRALPALRRLDAQPRTRCGNLFRRRDCLGCLREPLREALQLLGEH